MSAILSVPNPIGFLLALARVGGVVALFPLPGVRKAPALVRAFLALSLTLVLRHAWPEVPEVPLLGQAVSWALAEAAFGLAVGLTAAYTIETLQVAAQVAGFQAGFGYASTIDPQSEADSGILQVMMSLSAGSLFFAMGVDREILRVLSASFDHYPADAWSITASSLPGLVSLGGGVLVAALRLSFPVVAILLALDLALALAGKVEQHLQLLSLAFPAKMMVGLAVIALLAPMVPRFFEASAKAALKVLWTALGS